MPPPKRPSTTSSLTSSLKSTFANQSLLNNLTNLDKLTEHATNLAHKAPFFDALNEQFQQARAQDTAGRQTRQQPSTITPAKPTTSSGANAVDTLANSKPIQNVANPSVEMSHLNEEERLMIQTVMAKAEISNTNSTIPNSVNMNQFSQMNQPMLQQQQQQQPQHRNQRTQPTSMTSQPFQQSQMRQGMAQNTAPIQQVPIQTAIQTTHQHQLLNQQQQGYGQDLPMQQQICQSQPMNMTPGMIGQAGPQHTNNQSVNPNNLPSTFDQMNLNQGQVMTQPPNQQLGLNQIRAQQQMYNLSANNQSALTNPIPFSQQNLVNQNQVQPQYQQMVQQQQQDSQAINQPQMLASSQRPGLVQQNSLLGITSSQIPMQAQNNSATLMQPMTVIGQSNLNNQSDASLQHQQQMLFRDRNNLAITDAAGNIITTTMQDLNIHNQQLNPLAHQRAFANIYHNPQPGSILRNRDGRDGIRFRSDTFREDYAVSDHDAPYDDERPHRGSRGRDGRSLRRYNSMESSSRVRQSSRERSRDARNIHERSVPAATVGLARQRQLPKLAQLGKQPVQHGSTIQSPIQPYRESRPQRSRPTMRRSALSKDDDRGESLSLSSDSELDDVSIASSNKSEKRMRAQRNVTEKQSSSRLQHCAKSVGCEMSDESIKRLGEHKLTEQASQVMEQQQLLIQQSQELIKLQQAQLEKQSINKEMKESTPNQMDQMIKQADQGGQNTVQQSTAVQNLEKISDFRQSKAIQVPQKAPIQVRNTGNQTQESRDSVPRPQISKATSVDSIDLNNIENDAKELEPRISRRSNQNTASKKTKPVAPDVTGLERVSLPRYSLNYLKSPSETTDSDAELVHRRSSSRCRHRELQSSQSNRYGRTFATQRREPMGLPPSPLPVSAAIQLHQLQQKHSRDDSDSWAKWAKNRREAYSRSKSVCNSPNHMLNNANFSCSIDESRQLDSPDTMSAFGGRRKRLPEPPSNSMPLTPSMVRKMIEAQKSAATSSNKLLTSVNAQSTLLTNMHTYHNPCFDRTPNETLRHAINSRPISKYLSPASYARRSVGGCGAQVSFVDSKNAFPTSSDREITDWRRTDYGRYVDKTNQANSILKGSRYQDLFGKPSLASQFGRSRIQELNSRYDFDSRHQLESSTSASGRDPKFGDLSDLGASSRVSDNFRTDHLPSSTYSSNCTPKHGYPLDSVRNSSTSYRRNSAVEGESMSSIGDLSLQGRPNYSPITGDGIADQSNRLSLSAFSSPVKRYSRFESTNEHYPASRYDLSSQEVPSSANRHLSHWPASYLDSVASPRTRDFENSLEGVDSNRKDNGRWTVGGLGRYASWQTERNSDLSRQMLRDPTTRRDEWYADRTGANISVTRYATR